MKLRVTVQCRSLFSDIEGTVDNVDNNTVILRLADGDTFVLCNQCYIMGAQVDLD